jgi:ABC-type branched-subunit amino acid transport system ATPase component
MMGAQSSNIIISQASSTAPLIAARVSWSVSLTSPKAAPVLGHERARQPSDGRLPADDRAYVIDRGRITKDGPAMSLASDSAIREAYMGIA